MLIEPPEKSSPFPKDSRVAYRSSVAMRSEGGALETIWVRFRMAPCAGINLFKIPSDTKVTCAECHAAHLVSEVLSNSLRIATDDASCRPTWLFWWRKDILALNLRALRAWVKAFYRVRLIHARDERRVASFVNDLTSFAYAKR
ncbi:hypothetical protein CVT26_013186 [Gymnopilus dilepis]|uniref:Uncharacterized protein n=1 Tax=Gymnopilus dilepis TaxID=231916 RepID=A0A409VWG6_9AGAR|nr:hypothetical protein CVT26_013186 [Gymnopilus dilepis]